MSEIECGGTSPPNLSVSRRKLTRELLLYGSRYRKTIQVAAYGGAELVIRPVSDINFARASALSKFSLNDFAKLEELSTQNDANLATSPQVADIGFFKMVNFFYQLCKFGIVDPEIVKMLKEFDPNDQSDFDSEEVDPPVGGLAICEIGTAILDISRLGETVVRDFFGAMKDE